MEIGVIAHESGGAPRPILGQRSMEGYTSATAPRLA